MKPLLLFLLLLPPSLQSPPLRPTSLEFEPFQEIIPRNRLPRAIFPSHYTVELQPILDEGHGTRFTAPGKVWINTACLFSTSNITLHSLHLNISHESVKVHEFPTTVDVPVTSITYDEAKEQMMINFGQLLRPGQVYRIYIEFVAPVSRDLLIGLYLSNYTAATGETRYMAVTDLEATDARRVFPCFDEPNMKAVFDISILRLEKYHSLSNMNLLRTEDVPNLPGWVKDVYAPTEMMSTYLFCIAVSDFEMEEASPGLYSKPVRVWGPPPYMRAGAGKYSPDLTAKLMTALELYFQVNYTFPKMDKISVPHFLSGAMENWGLNTYRLNRLLIEDGIATTADRISAAITLSHELVHQWFGNLVTCDFWNDLWLNEGFASYYSNTAMQDIGLESMVPLDTLVSDAVQRAMQYDASPSTHPIHYDVETPTEIRIMFDTITYSKGAALVRMMEAMLGEPTMRSGLTAYLKKYKHMTAHQDDLFNTLNEELSSLPTSPLPADTTLKTIMDDWTLQPGFPILKVTRMVGMVLFNQENFREDVLTPSDPTAKWNIPISLQLSTDATPSTTTKKWLDKTKSIELYPVDATLKWVIVNPRQTGYYRVSYNPQGMEEITEQLHTNHSAFDPQTRSALIDDNLNLAFSGYFTLNYALNMTMYIKNERHLVPWTSFLTNMAKPYRFFSRTRTGTHFKRYMLSLIKDTLTEIKLDPQDGEDLSHATILRTKLFEWACNLGDTDCIDYSVQKFKLWMNDPTNLTIISADLRASVYCTAIASGDQSHWDFALSQYLTADRDVTRVNLLRSLACSKSAFRLNQLLDLATDPNSGIDSAHRATAIQAVAGNSAGVDVAFNFVRNNFNTLLRRHGASVIADVVTALGNTLHTSFDASDLDKFMNDRSAALEPVKPTLTRAVSTVQTNIRWMERNSNQFDNFIRPLV